MEATCFQKVNVGNLQCNKVKKYRVPTKVDKKCYPLGITTAEKRQLTDMSMKTLYLTWGKSQQTRQCLPQRNFGQTPSSPCCVP